MGCLHVQFGSREEQRKLAVTLVRRADSCWTLAGTGTADVVVIAHRAWFLGPRFSLLILVPVPIPVPVPVFVVLQRLYSCRELGPDNAMTTSFSGPAVTDAITWTESNALTQGQLPLPISTSTRCSQRLE